MSDAPVPFSSLQSKEEDTCNVTIEALDADRCYSFRARVTAKESSYGPDTYPSDWSEVAHWQRGEPRGEAGDAATRPPGPAGRERGAPGKPEEGRSKTMPLLVFLSRWTAHWG